MEPRNLLCFTKTEERKERRNYLVYQTFLEMVFVIHVAPLIIRVYKNIAIIGIFTFKK